MSEQRAGAPGEPLAWAECLAARVCDDLAGLAAEPQGAGRIAARLLLMRAAWAGGTGAMALGGILALAEALPGRTRMVIDAEALATHGPLPEPAARLLLNALLLAAESLPDGGRIALAGDCGAEVLLLLEGPDAAWPAGLAAAIADAGPPADPRGFQAPFTVLLARVLGGRVSLLMGGEVPAPLLLTLPK